MFGRMMQCFCSDYSASWQVIYAVLGKGLMLLRVFLVKCSAQGGAAADIHSQHFS